MKDYGKDFIDLLARTHHETMLANLALMEPEKRASLEMTVSLNGKEETRGVAAYLVSYDDLTEEMKRSYYGLIVGFLDTIERSGYEVVRQFKNVPFVKIEG